MGCNLTFFPAVFKALFRFRVFSSCFDVGQHRSRSFYRQGLLWLSGALLGSSAPFGGILAEVRTWVSFFADPRWPVRSLSITSADSVQYRRVSVALLRGGGNAKLLIGFPFLSCGLLPRSGCSPSRMETSSLTVFGYGCLLFFDYTAPPPFRFF